MGEAQAPLHPAGGARRLAGAATDPAAVARGPIPPPPPQNWTGAVIGSIEAAWVAEPAVGQATLPLLANTAKTVAMQAGKLGTVPVPATRHPPPPAATQDTRAHGHGTRSRAPTRTPLARAELCCRVELINDGPLR